MTGALLKSLVPVLVYALLWVGFVFLVRFVLHRYRNMK